jgi:LCP family protein required for cell wall assembly
MRRSETKPAKKSSRPAAELRLDRLTQLLVATALTLGIVAMVIGADLWRRSSASEAIVQALSLTLEPPIAAQANPSEAPTADTMAGEPNSGLLEPTRTTAQGADTPLPCIPPDDWGLHIVQMGNTLQSLAARYGTDLPTLMRVNCLNTETIFVGQRLYVPGGVAFPTLAASIENLTFSSFPAEPSPGSTDPTATTLPPGMLIDPPANEAEPAVSVTGQATDDTMPLSGSPAQPALAGSPTPPPLATSMPAVTPEPTTASGLRGLVPASQTPEHGLTPAAGRQGADPVPTRYVPQGGIGAFGRQTPGAIAAVPEILEAPKPPATFTSVPEPAVPTPVPTATPKTAFKVNIPNRYLNIVLLGSDKRVGSGAWRTDTMIVASLDVEDNIVRLLSIPRDLWVYIPGHGYNRINTADLWGELAKKGSGTERVKQTIHYNLGIPIHYYVRVDFKGFMKIIDTVGGIDVDVDCPLPDIEVKAGMHHMDGAQALRYARSRKSTSDIDRGRRQRKVLLALWDQALTKDMIPKLPALWVTMADAFETDLPLDHAVNLAYIGAQLKPQHIISRAITHKQLKSWTTPQGAQVLLPREDRLREFLEGYYTPKDRTKLDAVDRVRVQVLNGAERSQAEALAAATLRWDGFQIVSTGVAERQDYAQTQIIVFHGNSAAAGEIAEQLEVPLTSVQDLPAVQDTPGLSGPVDIQVILGKDYDPCQR